ncbi:hypothetical protein pdam_00012743 [Pocillopora damicornis]|uniref:Uncharacterized protein n=1 Tax=Pocillopora damicornis TaxID=46731 RepID=A0A3M6TTT1_POCDA|nr:hypothetical protein pdam_00012743 [Pocillopora damicornis]
MAKLIRSVFRGFDNDEVLLNACIVTLLNMMATLRASPLECCVQQQYLTDKNQKFVHRQKKIFKLISLPTR